MATAKSAGAAKYGRDSNPKYLGVKLYDGERARPGSIIVKQRGSHFRPGANVRVGGDDTIYSIAAGTVKFSTKQRKGFDGSRKTAKIVSVVPPKV